jgi:transketolase
MVMKKREQLEAIAKKMRQRVFKIIVRAGGGHVGASLSIIELLTVLYNEILNVDPARPDWPERDRFILSKGHAGSSLYVLLAERGFFPNEELWTFCQSKSRLGGHPDMRKVPGVDASTGALGHGFPFATGVALGAKKAGKDFRVFAMLGDGECQEGTVWESAMFAAHQGLDNLVAIVDYNKLQAMDRLDNIITLSPLRAKWEAFGWNTVEIDGHDVGQIAETLARVPFEKGRPSAVIANTIKGKGISFMEQTPIWHFRLPNEEEMQIVYRELDIRPEEMGVL